MISIIKPKRPTSAGWRQSAKPAAWVSLGYEAEAWTHMENGLFVISAVEVANNGDGVDKGPEYHVSVSAFDSNGTRRCSSADAVWVLGQFELVDGEEDNHVPNGLVRNFWRPVADRLVGIECACKDAEPAMREDKGDYVWRGVQS